MGSDLFPISSIATRITKGTTPTSIGSSFVEYGINFVKSESITGARNLDHSKFSHIDLATHNRLLRSQLEENDILFSMAGVYLGKTAIVTEKDTPANTNQAVAIIRIDTSKANFKYVYYWLSQRYITESVNAACAQSAQPNINLAQIGSILLWLPNIETQRSIAATLSSLDDKIELNNRIIANLEAQAQAIFKSWFVDFEPFQDGEFEESELGLIPKGWRVARLGELCESVSTTHDFKKRKLIFLNTGDIDQGRFLHSNYSAVDLMPGQAKKSIKKHDILFSEIRPINKHFAYVNFDSEDYVVSTKLMVIRSKKINSRRLYQYLTRKDVLEELQVEAEARSGTFPQIRFDNIQRMLIVIACKEIEEKYSSILEPIYELIDQRIDENKQLVIVRDTLLPKLMSGEIEVPVER